MSAPRRLSTGFRRFDPHDQRQFATDLGTPVAARPSDRMASEISTLTPPQALRGLPRETCLRLAYGLFSALPSTRVLQIGADDPGLIEELTARGIDAVGHLLGDLTPDTAVGAERFRRGPLAALDPDRAFSTVVCSIWTSGDDLPAVTALLTHGLRLADRHLVLCVGRPL